MIPRLRPEEPQGQADELSELVEDVAPEPRPLGPSFSGTWNEQTAFRVAWPEPRSAELPDGRGDQVERSFFISLQGEDVRILITSISEGECNACQLVLSLFVFRKNEQSWYLAQESRDFVKAGRARFNNITDNIEVWHVGPDRFGLLLSTVGWYQGETTIYRTMYAFISDELVTVLEGSFHEYFSGLIKEEAVEYGMWFEQGVRIDIDRSNSSFGFFDLEVTYFSSDTKKELRRIIRFDGVHYPLLDLSYVASCAGTMKSFIDRGTHCA